MLLQQSTAADAFPEVAFSDFDDGCGDDGNDFKGKQTVTEWSASDERCMAMLAYMVKHNLSGQASCDLMELFRVFDINALTNCTLSKVKGSLNLVGSSISDPEIKRCL